MPLSPCRNFAKLRAEILTLIESRGKDSILGKTGQAGTVVGSIISLIRRVCNSAMLLQ